VASSASKTRTSSVIADFGGLSQVTGESLAGLIRTGNLFAETIARSTAGTFEILRGGLPSPPTSLLRYAGGNTSTLAAAGGAGVVIGPITVYVGALAPGGLTPQQAGTQAARSLATELGRIVSPEAKFLGSGRL
jgi:hypothetical protein